MHSKQYSREKAHGNCFSRTFCVFFSPPFSLSFGIDFIIIVDYLMHAQQRKSIAFSHELNLWKKLKEL